jgi:hypothetical protein
MYLFCPWNAISLVGCRLVMVDPVRKKLKDLDRLGIYGCTCYAVTPLLLHENTACDECVHTTDAKRSRQRKIKEWP